MDPLSVLRDFTIRGELDKIIRVNDEFRFGTEYSFPCSAETTYRSKQGNLYNLETLVFYIQNHHLKHTDYMHNSLALRIPAVTFTDRKPLLDYLTGKVSTSDSIVWNPPKFPDEFRPNPSGFDPDSAKPKVIGFFMWFEDDSVESCKIVKQWNVKIISISKNKRHQDRAAALEVWDRLEEFVRGRSHS